MMVRRLQLVILSAGLTLVTGCLGPQSEEPTLRNARQPIGDRNQGGGGNGGGGNQNRQLNFAQANAIIKEACGGAACHGDGASGGRQKYVDDQQKLTERKGPFVARINNGSMPPANTKTFKSEADKKALIAFVQSLGNGGGNGGGGNAISFDVANNIMKQACSGASCHSTGSSFGVYVDNEANTKRDVQKLLTRVGNNTMPISKSYQNSDDKEKLLQYLNSVK